MKNKFVTALLSLVIAFSLWAYVITNVSVEETSTLENVPVIFQNEGALTSHSLILTEGTGQTVTLTVTGTRSEVMKLHPNNVSVVVDLSRIYDPGRQSVQFAVNYPADVVTTDFQYTADKSRITLTVENLIEKRIPVNVVYSGTPAAEYQAFTESEELSSAYIRVEGPASVVDQMTQALIQVDLEGANQSIRNQPYPFTLCDAEGVPVEVPNVEHVVTDMEEVELSLTIQRVVNVTLNANLISGAGATRDTTVVEIDPLVIQVTGTDEALELMGDTISLGDIELEDYILDSTLTLPINMPAGITNLSDMTEAAVSLSFPDISTKTFVITNIQPTNVPAGLIPEIVTSQITVTVRGPKALVDRMNESHITVSVSFGDLEIGVPDTVKSTVVVNPNFTGVAVLSNGNVTISLQEPAPDPTIDPQADPGVAE